MSADTREAAVAAVARRHPQLTGPAFDRKVARVAAILTHAHHGPTWTTTANR